MYLKHSITKDDLAYFVIFWNGTCLWLKEKYSEQEVGPELHGLWSCCTSMWWNLPMGSSVPYSHHPSDGHSCSLVKNASSSHLKHTKCFVLVVPANKPTSGLVFNSSLIPKLLGKPVPSRFSICQFPSSVTSMMCTGPRRATTILEQRKHTKCFVFCSLEKARQRQQELFSGTEINMFSPTRLWTAQGHFEMLCLVSHPCRSGLDSPQQPISLGNP